MNQNLDQAVLSGDESLIDEALDGLELDEALLFGEEGEDFDQDDTNQNIEAEQPPAEESNLPEVIDTQEQDAQHQSLHSLENPYIGKALDSHH